MLTPQFLLPIHGELVIDLFAGGGGASTGIEQAIGRPVDVAINHDREAVALHQANHPQTLHLVSDVFEVDPLAVTQGRPVGGLWASPDCTFHSKARGGKPFRDRGQPCPKRKGSSFRRWVASLQNLGYAVEWRELRACDYGAPTIRKRLFLVARRDGQPITWPSPTHAQPDAKGKVPPGLKPWRTAADCIDWSIPAPSIFNRARPLAEATCRRIAKGIVRYVYDVTDPFVAPIPEEAQHEHTDPTRPPHTPLVPDHRRPAGRRNASGQGRQLSTGKPGREVHGIPAPHLDEARGPGASGLHLCPQGLDTGANQQGAAGQIPQPESAEPEQIGAPSAHIPTLIQTGYGERPGQAPRVPGLDKPLGTVVSGQKHALVSAFLAKHYTGVVGSDMADPMGTVTTVDHHSLVTANIVKMRGDNVGSAAAEPLHTISAQGTHHAIATANLVQAFLVKYSGTDQDPAMREPLHTVTTKDRFGLVTVRGQAYQIADIGLRMLTPRELYRAQGFPESYVINRGAAGEPITKTAQVRMCGNSVCPPLARAIVAANYAEQHAAQRRAA